MVAFQAPLFMEFSRPEYWSGLPFPYPGDLPDPGIEPGSPALQADSLLSEPPGSPMDIVHAYKIFRVVSQQQRTKELTRALVAHMAIEGKISCPRTFQLLLL